MPAHRAPFTGLPPIPSPHSSLTASDKQVSTVLQELPEPRGWSLPGGTLEPEPTLYAGWTMAAFNAFNLLRLGLAHWPFIVLEMDLINLWWILPASVMAWDPKGQGYQMGYIPWNTGISLPIQDDRSTEGPCSGWEPRGLRKQSKESRPCQTLKINLYFHFGREATSGWHTSVLGISGTSYQQAWDSFPRGHLSTGHPVFWAAHLSPMAESVCDYSDLLFFPFFYSVFQKYESHLEVTWKKQGYRNS